MVQFLKAPDSSGEHFAAERLGTAFTIEPMGRKGFIRRREPDHADRLMAERALKRARTIMMEGNYDVIILDEINVARPTQPTPHRGRARSHGRANRSTWSLFSQGETLIPTSVHGPMRCLKW